MVHKNACIYIKFAFLITQFNKMSTQKSITEIGENRKFG